MKKMVQTALCCLALLTASKTIEACTAFQLKSLDGAFIYCRSMEFGFPLDSNLLIVPRKTEYTGTTPSKASGLKWTTKYGFVGMNQSIAPTLVSDGLNEKGLVVGCLYLPGYAKYENPDSSKNDRTLGPWELPNLLLGTCATVDDVKSLLPTLLVAQESIPGMGEFILPLHYYICDSSGKVLIVEYINGTRFEHDNPLGVLTNSPPFDWQTINLSNFVNLSPTNVPKLNLKTWDVSSLGQGTGLLGLPGDYTPPSRFVRASLFSQWATPQPTASETVRLGVHVLNTFDIFEGIIRTENNDPNLKSLRPIIASTTNDDSSKKTNNLENTQWIILHDRTNLKTYFRGYNDLKLQMVDLKKINFEQPGFRQVKLQKEFTPEDVTNDAKPLKS